MKSRKITEESIVNFCTAVLPQFRSIMKNLEELDQDLTPDEFALHLMELGREQMSEVADPSKQDLEFMTGYIETLDHSIPEAAFFRAFAGGCIMGLVIINEVARKDFIKALSLVEEFSHNELNIGHN